MIYSKKCLDEIGYYQVIVSLIDGHSWNVKFYKELCQGEMNSLAVYPHDGSKLFFVLFDPTHIFKCVYNNFQMHKFVSCPSFDDNTISASFDDIKQLYELEFTKPVKMAYMLSDQCIHAQPIEKTNVQLASSVFSESTRNAFSWYVDNGYP